MCRASFDFGAPLSWTFHVVLPVFVCVTQFRVIEPDFGGVSMFSSQNLPPPPPVGKCQGKDFLVHEPQGGRHRKSTLMCRVDDCVLDLMVLVCCVDNCVDVLTCLC
jgi:hypothetical protein